MLDSPEAPFRPPLAFRLGVTGAIDLDPDALADLRSAVADVLDRVRRRCETLAGEAWARQIYANSGGVVDTRLAMVSPLAEGADRLVAGEAIARGYDLAVAMPFSQQEYEKDFDENIHEFRTMLAQADGRVLVLDGARGDEQSRSYEAVGRLVVRNCDLLVAIWDDSKPPKGRGGTKDTILFALRIGVPVWWIHAANLRPPMLVRGVDELRHPPASSSFDALTGLIEDRLKPAAVSERHHSSIVSALIAIGSRLADVIGATWPAQTDVLADFLVERMPPRSPLWSIHGKIIKALTGKTRPSEWTVDEFQGYFGAAYASPDRLSGAYAQRYRSTYFYVIVLAASALICPSLTTLFDIWHVPRGAVGVAAVEILSLTLLLGLIITSQVWRWHERWIGYRLLAELFRKQGALTQLGWGLPVSQVDQAARPGTARGAWIVWYFEAVNRAAPLAKGVLSGSELGRVRDSISAALVAGQIDYHQRRAHESDLAARRLFGLGEACFFISLAFVILKVATQFFVEPTDATILISFVAAVLPSISAAIFAFRAYAELEVIADQSERMVELLRSLKARLDTLDTAAPLASQELGRDLFLLTAAMLTDVAGWAQLFGMKAVEAG